jgi:4-amino-4-deoxy-L-arabinose transferase-like glycosyltransferase
MSNSPSTYRNLSAWLRTQALASSLIVLFCSTSVRIFLAWRADPIEMTNGAIPDSTTYLTPAHNLAEKGAFINARGAPEVGRTPGYPVFLAALMVLTGPDLRQLLLLQSVILSIGVVVLYWLARRILPPVMAFIGALLAAFSPWGAVLAGLPLSDGLFLLLLALIFFVMKLTDEAHNISAVVFGGVCVGLLTGMAVLVRPIWPLVILVPGALFLCYGPKRKGVWLLLTATLVCTVTPLELWRERNQREAQFNGLSDVAGTTAWRYLAARVRAEANGQNRHRISELAYQEDRDWGLSGQEADDERWRRAKAIFREHPLLTVYSFARSATEHTVHPSPDVLGPAKLNFHGDYFVFASLWGGLLIFAYLGWRYVPNPDRDDGVIGRCWLSTILVICGFLTLASGISFAAGSRLRAPLESIVPLLAAVGLVRVIVHSHAASAP